MKSVFSSGAFSFGGDIAQAITRENAPNPCLFIEGIGTVGVPLSKREAAIIWSTVASPVTSDSALKNTWSVDGSKITFQNKALTSWLNRLVLEIARE